MTDLRPSPALLVAALALALAVGGGVGYAAGSLPKNSVGSAQLKKGAVKSPDIKDGAVIGAKVQDGSLTGADVAANSLTGSQVDENTLVLPRQPGKLVVPGIQFRPENSGFGFGGFQFGGLTSVTGGTFVLPVNLPQGSNVTGIQVRVDDTDVGAVSVFVRRVDPLTGGHVDGLSVATTGAPGVTILTPSVPGPVSASDTVLIHVGLSSGSDYGIRGAVITYQ
jgi:hypothetical protein